MKMLDVGYVIFLIKSLLYVSGMLIVVILVFTFYLFINRDVLVIFFRLFL